MLFGKRNVIDYISNDIIINLYSQTALIVSHASEIETHKVSSSPTLTSSARRQLLDQGAVTLDGTSAIHLMLLLVRLAPPRVRWAGIKGQEVAVSCGDV